jgi:FdhD protein
MPEGVCRIRVRRYRDGAEEHVDEAVVTERTVEMLVNGTRIARVQCLPFLLREWAVGYLLTSRVADSAGQIREVTVNQEVLRVSVDAEIDPERIRELAEHGSVASGCAGGAFDAQVSDLLDCDRGINMMLDVSAAAVPGLMKQFQTMSPLFRATGGVHSAAIIQDGQFVAFADDIGRHNAVDKVVGACALKRVPLDTIFLVTSGRISLEVALKAARLRIPVVISPSAPTDRAIEVAARVHTTLIGFARGRRMTVYSADWRVICRKSP